MKTTLAWILVAVFALTTLVGYQTQEPERIREVHLQQYVCDSLDGKDEVSCGRAASGMYLNGKTVAMLWVPALFLFVSFVSAVSLTLKAPTEQKK